MTRSDQQAEVALTIGVVGAGLVGASLIYLIEDQRPDARIFCYEPNDHHAEKVSSETRATVFVPCLEDLARCSFVFVATPPTTVAGIVGEMLTICAGDCLVIDLASTKFDILQDLKKLGADTRNYIGGHPLAGGNTEGPRDASRDVLRDAPFVLSPEPGTPETQVDCARALLESLTFQPIILNAARHDEVLAMTSHLPHLASYAFAAALREMDHEQPDLDFSVFTSRSTEQMVHFASPNVQMWTDIFEQNQYLSAAIDRFILNILKIRAEVNAGGAQLRKTLSHANAYAEHISTTETKT